MMFRSWLKENWLVASLAGMVIAWGWGLAAEVNTKVDRDTFQQSFNGLVTDVGKIRSDVAYIRGKLDGSADPNQGARSDVVRPINPDFASYTDSCLVVGPEFYAPGDNVWK